MTAEETFRATLRQSGLEYDGPIIVDGKLKRFKADGDRDKNSWYVLFPGPPVAGAYGCWKRGIERQTWCEKSGSSLSSLEKELIRHRWQEAKAKLEAETVRRQAKARKIAAWILDRSRRAVTMHPYLYRKRVKVFGNLREYRRRLVVPLRDSGGELHNLQFIDKDGAKKFLSGGCVAGCFFKLADKPDEPLVICEGYSTGASIHEATGHAVICAMNSGNLFGVAEAARTVSPQREIIIAADNDQWTTKPKPNPGLTKATAAAKAIGAKLAVPQFDDLANKPTDFNDLAIAQGLDAVRQQVASARVAGEIDSEKNSDDETIARLAALSAVEYDRIRIEEADKLRCRVTTLDAEWERKRAKSSEGETLQGNAVDFLDVAPYETSVNGAQVLDEVAGTFSRYLVLPAGAADALALWGTQSHCYEAFEHVARLNCCSPDKSCGKTTTLDVTECIVARPLRAENITTAVLFRLVEKFKPTLLLDEVDTYLSENEELRGCLNAGHKRGGKVYRCEGQDNTVRSFAVFAPAALAGIGALPGTLYDRSVVIKLARAKAGEIAARFDSRKVEYERELCRKLARWTADNFDQLKNCDPQLPETAFNRLADNWRPLFAIAEVAGGDWPQRAHAAFVALTATADLDAQGVGTLLLSDIAGIFTAESTDRLPSSNLAESLAAIEGRPWAEWGKHRKAISTNQLANQLRRFGISPHVIRVGDETARGYLLEDFREAFSRYLPDIPLPDCNTVTTLGETPISEPSQAELVLHPEKAPSTRECYVVTPCTEVERGEEDISGQKADQNSGKGKLRL
jgi:putative DNA primase/helicase